MLESRLDRGRVFPGHDALFEPLDSGRAALGYIDVLSGCGASGDDGRAMGPARVVGRRLRAAARPRQGAVLTYEVRADGRVMYRRNFGDARDESEAVSATVNAEGLLNVMVYFPSLHQTREFGLLLQKDGGLRAIYNRSERGEYTIRDGKYVKTGEATPAQRRAIKAHS